jgi:hypothetical protein
LGALQKIGPLGLSENPRFEVLQKGREGLKLAIKTVLFDRNTGDILVIDYTGYIENVGPFGASVEAGKRK